MNQSIKPLTALAVLAVFAVLLAAKYWAHGEALGVSLYAQMHTHPNGNLYIMLGDRLYGFDGQGRLADRLDLADFGVEAGVATDFAFFSNGDLLLRRHAGEQGFIANLHRLFRFKNLQTVASRSVEQGLFRCATASHQCAPFGQPAPNLGGSFWLALDWESDQVFLADTARDSVYLFAKTGEKLDELGIFHFPNQIHYQDHKLYIADTNHYRMVEVGIKDGHFNGVLDMMDTRSKESIAQGEVWPATFLLLDGRRWVYNAKNNMAYGGVYIFDKGIAKRVALPPGADPFGLSRLGPDVLIGDYSQSRIYRLDAEGNSLPDFQPEVVLAYAHSLQAKKNLYRGLEWLFTGLFALGLALGFAAAIVQQRKTAIPSEPPPIPAPAITWDEADIHWIKPKTSIKWGVILSGPVSFLLLFFIGLMLTGKCVGIGDFIYANHLFLAMLSAYWLTLLLGLRRKIGVAENFLVIVPMLGKAQACAAQDIRYSGQWLLFGKTAMTCVLLMSTFPPEDVDERVYPMIKRGRQVEFAEIRAILWRQQRFFIPLLLMFAALLALYVYLSFKHA